MHLIAYVLLTLFLAACALADMPTNQAAPTPCQCTAPTPLPSPVIDGTCQQPLEFERWLQRASRLREEVGTILDGIETGLTEETLTTLQDMQTAIINLSLPDCAAQAHRLLLDAVSAALMALEDKPDSAELLQQAQTQLAAFDMLYEYLLQQLESSDRLQE
ncbi:MAG: hypothetical protein D6712_06650 [Chloroflexi bacterium]|nr:MAG: hypothetical protein D6712_06650 [Chloroflexota bacterium]